MKRPGFSWKYTLIIVGMFVLAYLVMDFNNRMASLRRLSTQKEGVTQQLAGQMQTQAYLQTQIAYATSDAAVEQWAYEEGDMVRSGDVPVVPLPPSVGTPMPTPTRVVVVTPAANWQFWLWLFVDPDQTGNANAP
jgi:cell division protein FtsB